MPSRKDERTKPTIDETLEALKAGESSNLPAADVFYGLSDLEFSELSKLKSLWPSLKPSYRRQIIALLAESSEMNFELDYRMIGLFATEDENELVRKSAIDLLWEDETLEVMDIFISLAKNDPSIEVRANAVSALGRFILLGEYEEIPEQAAEQAQKVAMDLFSDRNLDLEIRRRALEAISNSSHDFVAPAIREAYENKETKMKVSAIFAMGRSYDHQWNDIVLQELDSTDEERRFEATRASGELEIVESVPKLARLLIEEDREIKESAIWSLGEIGGREAIRVLEAYLEVAEQAEDSILVEAIEDAISIASFLSSGIFGFGDDDID